MAFLLSAGEELLPLSRCCIGSIGAVGEAGGDDGGDPCNITDSLVVSPCSSSSSSEEDEDDNDTSVAAPSAPTNTALAAPPPSTISTSSQSPMAPTTKSTSTIKGGLTKKEAPATTVAATRIPQDAILKKQKSDDVGNVTVPTPSGAVIKKRKGRQDLFEAGFEELFGLTAICPATATGTTAQQQQQQQRGKGRSQVEKSQNEKEDEEEKGKNGKASRMKIVPTTDKRYQREEEEDTTIATSLSEDSRSVSSTTATAIESKTIGGERSVSRIPFPNPSLPQAPSKECVEEDSDKKKTKSREKTNGCLAAGTAPETPLLPPTTQPRGVNQKTSDIQQQQQQQQSVLSSSLNATTRAIMDTVCFEMKFVGLASWTLVLYCMAHCAIYELIYTIVLETTETNGIYRIDHLNWIYGGLLVLGLAMLRGTGYLWNFLRSKHYRQTKAVLKERRLRGNKNSGGGFWSTPWDVRIHDWFEDRDVPRMTVEVIAFYLCYISLIFFWNKFLTNCVDQKEVILQQLPSVQYRLQQQVQEGKDGLGIISNIAAECNSVEATSKSSWDVEDFDYIYKTVAKTTYYQYSGSADAPLYSAPLGIMVYACTLGLSMFFLSKTGVSFGDTWE